MDFTSFDFDVENASVFALKEMLKRLNGELSRLDRCEPEDFDSDEYDDWADKHEYIEDLIDDIMDRLDEID